VPFKLNQDRQHIPRQKHKVTNWREYDASLRQRGSLTVWFTAEAVEAWAAEPRTTRGGPLWYSALAILTALTLRAVFRLAYRQTEGLIGSIIGLFGLTLRVPDQTTQPPGSDAGGAATSLELQAHAPAGGQHWPETLRCGRVAGGETRHPHASVMAEAAPERGCLCLRAPHRERTDLTFQKRQHGHPLRCERDSRVRRLGRAISA
jgi:hypothetical protein